MADDKLRNDPEQATIDARTVVRPKGAAPHWLRCTWYHGTRRCLLAEHGPNKEHEFAPTTVTS